MKIKMVSFMIILTMCLTACGSRNKFADTTETEPISAAEHTSGTPGAKENDIDELTKYKELSLSGRSGTISVQIPEGWESISFPDCGQYESYGIRFYPGDVETGYVVIAYVDSFGVCGTGLIEEVMTIAGDTVTMGTYDNHEYWDFIAYEGKNKGLVASTYCVDDWWDEYTAQAMEILGTVSFKAEDLSTTEGIYYDDTEVADIGLSIRIDNVSRSGAELFFVQSDGNPKGDLQYGDDFIIEKNVKGEWTEAPIVVAGDYGFNAIAYRITKDGATDFEIDWEWLYGELEPGEYRIGKEVMDFVETGSYDKYMVYVHFIIN